MANERWTIEQTGDERILCCWYTPEGGNLAASDSDVNDAVVAARKQESNCGVEGKKE